MKQNRKEKEASRREAEKILGMPKGYFSKKAKKIDLFAGSTYRKMFPLEKEKRNPELKAIFKMLDAVPWDIFKKYYYDRIDKESVKERKSTDKFKAKCAKEITSFIASSDFKDELKVSPISALMPIGNSGVTRPAEMTLSELRTISKEINK